MPISLRFTDYPICPRCLHGQQLVPIYEAGQAATEQVAGGESLYWKCAKCGLLVTTKSPEPTKA